MLIQAFAVLLSWWLGRCGNCSMHIWRNYFIYAMLLPRGWCVCWNLLEVQPPSYWWSDCTFCLLCEQIHFILQDIITLQIAWSWNFILINWAFLKYYHITLILMLLWNLQPFFLKNRTLFMSRHANTPSRYMNMLTWRTMKLGSNWHMSTWCFIENIQGIRQHNPHSNQITKTYRRSKLVWNEDLSSFLSRHPRGNKFLYTHSYVRRDE